ncbi:MAG: type II toxin-antitoxin system HicA family toxin [Phycisphaerae bacterium]|nr:type II toxin-antitoxin system HicA family toxin [Phycisphaerae bacterium]
MKYRDLIRRIKSDGWYIERTVGSHMQFRHPKKTGTLTIAAGGKLAKEVPPGTLGSILKQAGLK